MLSLLVLWVTVASFLVTDGGGHELVDLGLLMQQHVRKALGDFFYTRGLPVGSFCSSDADCTTGVCDNWRTRRCVCPSQFQQCGRLCYASFSSQLMTQADAQAHCRSLGAQLPVPRTQSENDCVFQKMRGLVVIWLGINNRDDESVFFAEDGLGPLYYTQWQANEPNYVNNGERCVHMHETKQGQWNDIRCDVGYPHVCQKG